MTCCFANWLNVSMLRQESAMGHGLLTAVVWLMFFYCCKDLGRGQKCFKICKYCQKGVRRARENTLSTHLSLGLRVWQWCDRVVFLLEHNKHARFLVTFEGPWSESDQLKCECKQLRQAELWLVGKCNSSLTSLAFKYCDWSQQEGFPY